MEKKGILKPRPHARIITMNHIALANGVERRLSTVLDTLIDDLADCDFEFTKTSFSSPLGRHTHGGPALIHPSLAGAATPPPNSDAAPAPLTSIGPSGIGGPYQTEIYPHE